MAITRVKKLVGRESPKDGIDSREFIEKYIVLSNSKDDQGDTIRQASHGGVTIPDIHDAYPTDSGALVVRVRAREESSNGVDLWKWVVDVEYSSNAAAIARSGGGGGGGSNDPTDWRWKRRWSTRPISRVVEQATKPFLDGPDGPKRPIATSAGEPFDPPIEEEEYVAVLTITRNQNTFSPSTFSYLNKCCSTAFYGFAPGEPRMASIEATEQFKGDLVYAEVTYEIEFKQGGWDREILNKGYWYLDEQNNTIKPETGVLHFLGYTGKILAPTEEPLYIIFRTKQHVDFGPLNLE